MTHAELDRLNRWWENRPRVPMTESEHAHLRQIWEDKIARIRETHGLDDNDARVLACEMYPRIIGELLAHPTRVSMSERIK